MAVRVGINGFGRIGRLVMRAAIETKRSDIQIVGLNDLGPIETNAHLLQYDSVHGRFPAKVEVRGDSIDVGGGPIKVTAERDPSRLPWAELGIDVALECTGIFTSREAASAHLEAGSNRVLTVVYGVNHTKLTGEHKIVSNASCTTNCLAPIAKALNDAIGIEQGFMTTIHAFTGDQPVLDTLNKDLRRARAAGMSMIPTSTGAAQAVGLVLPELAGKLDGTAIRVPTPNVSLIDLTFTAATVTNVKAVNDAVVAAANGPMEGILNLNAVPLVSMDFNHDPASSTFDLSQTYVIGGTLVRVLSWYDNEWGFSNRMNDVAALLGDL